MQEGSRAQAPSGRGAGQGAQGAGRGRGGYGGPIELGPDDKPAFPDPPAGFNARRDDIPHGELTAIEYDSKSLGTRRRMRVYTPPGYSTSRKYPVLYLLHGIGGTDTEWTESCHANVIIDNLLAEGRIQPIVMVFPDGNSSRTRPISRWRPRRLVRVAGGGLGRGARSAGGAPGAGAAPAAADARMKWSPGLRRSRTTCSKTSSRTSILTIPCIPTAIIAPWPVSRWAAARL